MGGRLVPLGVRSQGSTTVTDKWACARYGVALQLLTRAWSAAFNSEEEAAGFFRKEVPKYLQQEHNRNNNEWGRNKDRVSVGGDGNGNENFNNKNHDNTNDNDKANENDLSNENNNENDLTNESN